MSDAPASKHKFHWLPNALTVSRMLLIPVLVWGLILPHRAEGQITNAISIMVFGIFVLCMVTDFLDGYFARKWQVTSPFGRMLDPIADKLLVASCLICITILHAGMAAILIPAFVIIGRDIFVSGIREHAANSNIILSPTKLAKWKTACEMVAILFYLIALAIPLQVFGPNKFFYNGFLALIWLAALLSAYTGFHYFRSAMRKT